MRTLKILTLFILVCFTAACKKPVHSLNVDPEFKKSKQYQDIFRKEKKDEYAELQPLKQKPDPDRIYFSYQKSDQFILHGLKTQHYRGQIVGEIHDDIFREVMTFQQDMVILGPREDEFFQKIIADYVSREEPHIFLYSHPDRHVRELVLAKLLENGVQRNDISVKDYVETLKNFSPYSVYIEMH